MKHYIQIEHPNGLSIKDSCTNLLDQISTYIHESGLFDEPSSCHGLKVIVNPDLSTCENAKEISNNVFLAFFQEGIVVNSSALNNFQLRCIHLKLGEGINNILIIIMPSISDVDNNSLSGGDDEAPAHFDAINPKYKLSQVVMNNETKRQIQRAITLVRNQKLIFEEWGFNEVDPNTKTILCFYGAPGTGKTMCAHALASELNKKLMVASYASIESKWVGEGPKNLRAIFQNAAEQDAVLFFDEADSFLSKRVNNAETGSDKHYNRMSNEMFQLLEDYNGIVIFATNLVSDFDKAFKSRILAFIEFSLPDAEARINIIKHMIPKKLPLASPLTQQQLEELSVTSDGFSGREIRKSILTSLTNAAVSGQKTISFDCFADGFNSIKTENEEIEQSFNGSYNKKILSDFLTESSANDSIMKLCLYISWQNSSGINDRIKLHIYKLSRLLNMDMPDMTISYQQANWEEYIQNIKTDDKNNEAAKYCCETMSIIESASDRNIEILNSILLSLDVSSNSYVEYYNCLTNINKK